MVCNKCGREEGIDKQKVEEYKLPFKCECGNIQFPYEALNGITFLWPKPVEDKTKGGFIIPNMAKEGFKSYYALVLSVGEGCLDKKTGNFIESKIKVGDIVLYDKSIPWGVEVESPEGNKYPVKIANILDITAKVKN